MTTANIGAWAEIVYDDSPLWSSTRTDATGWPANGVIGQCRNFSGLTQEADEVDVTNFGSGTNREFIAGLVDNGEAELEIIYNETDAEKVYNDWNYPTASPALFRKTMAWELRLSSGTEDNFTGGLQFDGYVKAINWEIPVDDAILMNITIRVTGPVVFDSALT